MTQLRILLTVAVLCWSVTPALAVVLETGGFTFSDELGGMRLVSAKGAGTAADPIILVEEFIGSGPAVLTIRRLPYRQIPGAVMRQMIPSNLRMEKIVVNRTGRNWVGFNLELQEILTKPSTYGDGLSFDQFSKKSDGIKSDRFDLAERTFEPSDRLQFFEGSVTPGKSVRFTLPITDASPIKIFYLVQQPHFVFAGGAGRNWAASDRRNR